jgi:phytoene dehydrogenase-like protein
VPGNVVIVGGGLAGLAASIYLARAGKTVTVFEKRQALGGRAVTHLRQGFRFNLGAHALYRTGTASAVYRELGIPIPGRVHKSKAIGLLGGDEYRLPTGFFSLFTTGLMPLGARFELARMMWHVRRRGGAGAESLTVREWLDANFTDPQARGVMAAFLRLATYTAHDTQSAAFALAQMQIAMRGAIYVDEGWQRIVDSMHSTAVTSGVNFVSSSRIVGVHHDASGVKSVELGGLELDSDRMDTQSVALPEMKPEDVQGARIPAGTVLLAVDPHTAAELLDHADFAKPWTNVQPVTASCLDVGLRSLPEPRNTFAIGIDEPVYFSVHSVTAQLAPKGGALVHLVKYRTETNATNQELDGARGSTTNVERELETLLDKLQEGWRDVLVHRRFLPAMTVSNAMPVPNRKRPSPVTPVRGLYIAGDWVGDTGVLSDAALASARDAAKAILREP